MSYQIKSTPYFRRMFNNSKKNGQLQRLREEYERIQEFNDRTIELKMRQVRLKRLFREIEEIKEGVPVAGVSKSANTATRASGGGSPPPTSTSQSAHRRHHPHPHHHQHPHQRFAGITPEQRRSHQRAEALIRSRELGKQLSRRNAQMTESGMGGFLRADLRATAKMKAVADARRDALDRRERAAKRISYGNDQSRQNLERQLNICKRRLTAKHQPEIRPQTHLRPDYRHLTPSQLDLLVDEEELAAEQQRYFRQEEDELQLAEERFRREEERLRLQAEYSEEGLDDPEELRFLRGERALSAAEEEGNDESAMERRRQPQLKRKQHERSFRGHKDELELARERFSRRKEADYSDEGQVSPAEGHRRLKQVDEKEAEQQRRRLHMREKTSPLPLGRFSLSSTTTESPLRHVKPAQNARSHHHYRSHHPQYQQVTLSSDQEMRTAPLASEEYMASLVDTRSTTIAGQQPPPTVGAEKDMDPEADQLPALNNWRRVSLMMPWFKAFSARKPACPEPRSFAGPTDKQLRGGDTAEPQPHQQ